MVLRTWRFLTIFLVSLSMAMAFCHLLQLPPRMTLTGSLWLSTQVLYLNFGYPIGALIESSAWVAAVVLAFLVRHRRPAYQWTLIAMICMVAAQVSWWLLIFPVNNVISTWTPATVPVDWTRFRDQWEYTHAVRAVLQMIALCTLVFSILIETPDTLLTESKSLERKAVPPPQHDRAAA